MATNTVSRALHDIGLAAWFGGTLANAVALNPAAAEAGLSSRTGAVANVGWDRWTPVNAAAIAAHLVGSVGQLGGNAGRVNAQQGVAQMAVVKTALTAAARGVRHRPDGEHAGRRRSGAAPAQGAAVGRACPDRCTGRRQRLRRRAAASDRGPQGRAAAHHTRSLTGPVVE